MVHMKIFQIRNVLNNIIIFKFKVVSKDINLFVNVNFYNLHDIKMELWHENSLE